MFLKLSLFAVILTVSIVSSYPAKVDKKQDDGDIIKQSNATLPFNTTGNGVNSIHSPSEVKLNIKRCTDCGNSGGHHTNNIGPVVGSGFLLGRPAVAIA